MKFLKWQYMFSEHRSVPMLISFSILLINILFSLLLFEKGNLSLVKGVVLLFYIPTILFVLLLYLYNKPNAIEREKIANSKSFEWKTLEFRKRLKVRNKKTFVMFWWMFLYLIELILSTGLMLKFSTIRFVLPISLIMVISTTLCLIYERYNCSFWKGIDGSAQSVKIPIDHCFFHRIYGRLSIGKGIPRQYFCVCYLPDGKYVFSLGTQKTEATHIEIIRYRGRFCYLVDED